jgi:hypothetical protein
MLRVREIRPVLNQSAYSSVGRAGDCSCEQSISLGPWFESGWAELLESPQEEPPTGEGLVGQ